MTSPIQKELQLSKNEPVFDTTEKQKEKEKEKSLFYATKDEEQINYNQIKEEFRMPEFLNQTKEKNLLDSDSYKYLLHNMTIPGKVLTETDISNYNYIHDNIVRTSIQSSSELNKRIVNSKKKALLTRLLRGDKDIHVEKDLYNYDDREDKRRKEEDDKERLGQITTKEAVVDVDGADIDKFSYNSDEEFAAKYHENHDMLLKAEKLSHVDDDEIKKHMANPSEFNKLKAKIDLLVEIKKDYDLRYEMMTSPYYMLLANIDMERLKKRRIDEMEETVDGITNKGFKRYVQVYEELQTNLNANVFSKKQTNLSGRLKELIAAID